MDYYRVFEGDFGKGKPRIKMIGEDTSLYSLAKKKTPVFASTYKYNEEHKKQFDKTRSVAGITDLKANALWWDIDCEQDTSKARETTKIIVNKLKDAGIPEEGIQVRFSGGKGYHIWVDTEQTYSPSQVQSIATSVAGNLPGFDTTLYDANQLLRVPFSINEKTKLYCIPLTLEELTTLDEPEIKAMAKSTENFDLKVVSDYYKKVKLPNQLDKEKDNIIIPEKKVVLMDQDLQFDLNELDFKSKPKHLDNARWALQNGFFYGSENKSPGDRHHAFLCLAATYANMGYNIEQTYGLLKGVAKTQAARTGEDRFPNEEIYEQILKGGVYSDAWRGGQYTLRDKSGWLYQYAVEYGVPLEEDKGIKPLTIGDIANEFTHFVKHLDENTIKLGIPELDEAIPVTIGMNMGIVAAAGAGKTALALEILENTSAQGVISVCASLDMHRNRLYQKLLHRVTGLDRKELYRIFKDDPEERRKIVEKVKEKYKNVWFYDRSSPSIDDIRYYIHGVEKASGQKVKLILIDYFERVGSTVSDETASSKRVAGGIQDLISDFNVACITLTQPNKFSLGGGPNSPILDYTAIKGSSFLYQSFRGIISLWRPFYTPELKEHDHYMEMAILKNDLGEIGTFQFGWNGRRGQIKPLEDIERADLQDLKDNLLSVDDKKGRKDDF